MQLYLYFYIKVIFRKCFFIKNLLLQNNKISVSIVKKIILDISLLFYQFIIKQNVYKISCMCQHKLGRR